MIPLGFQLILSLASIETINGELEDSDYMRTGNLLVYFLNIFLLILNFCHTFLLIITNLFVHTLLS
jgi:hypothetical protein